MKRMLVILMAVAMLAACGLKGGKVTETYKSSFKGVPYADLTKFDKGGPPAGK
jgi:hypothetical protein